MESALYKSISARGEARGLARAYAGTITKVLQRWLGSVDASVRQHVGTFPDQDVIAAWHDEALELTDVESARKLLEKIQNTPVPPSAEGSPQAA